MTASLTIDQDLARITLNNPDRRNAFDDQTIDALIAAFQQAESSAQTRLILLSAEGSHFSAGADLTWMKRMGELTSDQNRTDALRLAKLMHTIDQAAKPVVCRVQGAAYGGALGLICAADIAIASHDARFCLSEVRLGILPAVISPYVVRAMGARQAQRYFMTAEVFDAKEASRLGIVHEQVTADTLDTRISEILAALRLGAPQAQLASRSLIARVAGHTVDQAMLADTAELIATLRTSAEGQEGLSAFLDKRQPLWSQS